MNFIVAVSFAMFGLYRAMIGLPVDHQLPFEILVPEVIYDVQCSPDGKVIASCSSKEDRVRLWDTKTGQCYAALEGNKKMVWCVAFSPDGKVLACADAAQTIRLWDVKTQVLLTTLEGDLDHPGRIAFDPTGKILAVCCFKGDLQLWDLATKKCAATLKGHTDSRLSLAFSPDGKILASGSYDKTLRLWDVAKGKEMRMVSFEDEVMALAFTADGTSLLSGIADGTVRRQDLATDKTQEVKIKQPKDNFGRMAFSSDGKLCVTGEFWFGEDEKKDAGITVWDVATGNEVARLEGHKTKVSGLAFSPDGKKVASGGGDGIVNITAIPQHSKK
jgi:WD40 repeat protein